MRRPLQRELAEIAIRRLQAIDKHDVERAARALRRVTSGAATRSPAWLIAGGVAVGVGVGLLVAPETGKQTRARLRSWAGKQSWLGNTPLLKQLGEDPAAR